MLRISLIIAIVAGLAAAGLNFWKVREVIVTTMQERDSEKAQKEEAQRELSQTKKTLKKTEEDLASTQKKLENTVADLTSTREKLAATEREVVTLNNEIERCKSDRDVAQQEIERWRQIGMTPDQVKGVLADLKKSQDEIVALNAENKTLGRKVTELTIQMDKLVGKIKTVPLPAGLKGRVIAVDPKYDFVVLDIGSEQGVLEDGEMLVNRNGKLIGKVRISSKSANQSVANLLPEWKTEGVEIMEGDQVLY